MCDVRLLFIKPAEPGETYLCQSKRRFYAFAQYDNKEDLKTVFAALNWFFSDYGKSLFLSRPIKSDVT